MAKIVFFVSSMQGGGAERVAALLCNEWVANGHEVKLVPTFSAKGTCAYPLDERVQLEYLADRVARQNRHPLTQLRRLLEVRRVVKEFDADVVVSFLTRVNLAVLMATRGLSVPVIVAERTFLPKAGLGGLTKTLCKWLYARASHVVVQTQAAVTWLHAYCPAATAVVIPNPVVYPTPARVEYVAVADVLAADECLLLAVGRLHHAKGFDLLLTAFAELSPRFPQWRLVILGDGELRDVLLEQCVTLGIADQVSLPGIAGNVAEWYERADLFVLSSRYEGFPNALLEAMAHGTAVVSYNCDTGPADMIEDGENGVLVPPASTAAGLSHALERLMLAPQERARLAAAAANVRDVYALGTVAQQWTALFNVR